MSALRRLHELKQGDAAEVFALLAERTAGTTRDGKPYFSCKFRDAKRTASYMVWVDGRFYQACLQDWKVGQVYLLRTRFHESERYGPQLEIDGLRPATDEDRALGYNPADFSPHSRFDPAKMFDELTELAANEISDELLRKLVLNILDAHHERLLTLPATEMRFFPFPGGWLEHVLSVARSCCLLADRYIAHYPELTPPLNRGLVIAGAILHDIGRVAELTDGPVPEPTVPGRLLGHMVLGRDLVREAAREIPGFPPELLLLLEHMIMSHLVIPEWGSPRLPYIPEVLILHHADDLDAKMEMFVRCLSRDTTDGPFTAREPSLNRPLLKVRGV